jgi:hypothetical protein
MRRLSELSSPEDFDREERREKIRNSRCRRYVGVILGISVAINLPGLSAKLAESISTLSQALMGS